MTRLVSLGGALAAVSTSLDGEERRAAVASPPQRAAADTSRCRIGTQQPQAGGSALPLVEPGDRS